MALTQVFPRFEASLIDFDLGGTIPRSRPSVGLEFRSGADLRGIVDKLSQERYVTVNAAPGAGKSTALPLALARAVEGLVLHVLPFPQLAAVTHAYVSKTAGDSSVVFVDDVNQDYPVSGLCITYAAQVVARWLQDGRPSMPDCFVLHDESHESGVASAAMRSFMPTLSGVRCYALMSATGTLEPARRMETSGKVDEKTYQPDKFADPWSVEEFGAPWSAVELQGHVLIFEDNKARAAALVQAFNYNGLLAYRLHAGSSVKEILNVFKQFDDPRANGLCAFVADSTYRSGYTFPVSVVIDSGVVRRMVVEDGVAKEVQRPIYEFEHVQSRSRGGRMPGQQTVYWKPVGDCPAVLCDLEQADVEALALVYRALGFRPTREVASAKMATGPIPKDICAALRGHVLLACLPDCDLVDTPRAVRRAPVPTSRVQTTDNCVSVTVDKDVVRGSRDSAIGLDQLFEDPVQDESSEDVLAGIFSSLRVRRERVQLGEYCIARGLVSDDVCSIDFPKGVDSVMRVLGTGVRSHVYASWSDYQRSVAMNALVNSHNVDLLQWRAWTRLLKYAKSKTSSRDPVALRKWAVRCAEEASRLAARTETALSAVLEVSEGYVEVVPADGLFQSEEDRLYQAFVRDFEGLAVVDDSRAVEHKRRLKGWVDVADSLTVESLRSRQRVGHSGSVEASTSVPAWLKYAAGYTGNLRPRVERLGDGRSEGSGNSDSKKRLSGSVSVVSSNSSSGKRRLSFVR